jgi:hypothetical protein
MSKAEVMTETPNIPNESKTRSRFVIASEARQSSALFLRSGLLRRSAPRNDKVLRERAQ